MNGQGQAAEVERATRSVERSVGGTPWSTGSGGGKERGTRRGRPGRLAAGLPETASLGRSALSRMLAEEGRYGHGFLWVPVLMGAGAAAELAAAHAIPMPAILLPLAICLAAAVFGHVRGRRWAFAAIAAAAFFVGMASAVLQIERLHTTVLDGEVVTHIDGVVTNREIDAKGDWRYTIRLHSTRDPVIRRPPETVRLLARSKHVPIEVGQTIGGLARLSPPSGPALPGEFNFAFNSYFQGLGAIGFFYGPPKLLAATHGTEGFWSGLDEKLTELREGIDRRIRKVLPGDDGALAAALIVSDRRAISDPLVQALRAAGLAHILSISGLHMALVAGTLFFLLRTGLGLSARLTEAFPVKKIAAAAALVVTTIYLALSGAEVATVRSWVMLAIMLGAVILDRPALTLRNVALAALVIILANPAAVVGPSFQMSFAATVALVAGYSALSRRPRRQDHDERQRRGIGEHATKFVAAVVFTSLIAGSATSIFAAYHFHRIALFGILGNLLAEPVITLLVMPMGLLATLMMPYGLEGWPLTFMGWGLDGVIAIARGVEALGGVAVTGRMPPHALIVFVAGFLILVLMRSKLRLAGVAVMAVGLALTRPPLTPAPPAIVVSEDGRMVGLPGPDAIAVNRSRPSSFIFDQWLSALDKQKAIKPRMLETDAKPRPHKRGEKSPPPTPQQVALMRQGLASATDGRFVCLKKSWCGVTLDNVLTIATVEDLAYLGTACDLADIVVTAARIHMKRCRSGALLFTGRTLRHSGAIAIDVRPAAARSPPVAPGRSRPPANAPPEQARTAVPVAASAARDVELRIVSALGEVVRPWTIQRYYDWRSRGFDFSETVPQVSDSGGLGRRAGPGS